VAAETKKALELSRKHYHQDFSLPKPNDRVLFILALCHASITIMRGKLCQVILFIAAVAVAAFSSLWNGLLDGMNYDAALQSHLDEFLGLSSDTTATHTNKTIRTKPNKPYYLLQKPTHQACDNYKGILHIASGDKGAAAPTVLFQYVINQLIYADMHNLLPWVHLNTVSEYIYDSIMHDGITTTLHVKAGMEIGWDKLEGGQGYHVYPGTPYLESPKLHSANYTVVGTGVWESYFLPVSDYRKSDKSCRDKPVLSMTYAHLMPGTYFYAPWAVRSWPYKFVPPSLKPFLNETLQEWFEPMRIRANEIVNKYYRFQPSIVKNVERILPTNTTCLALHVRHADKAGFSRRQIRLAEFLPYAKAFLENGGKTIYLATDTQNVNVKVREKWSDIQHHVKTQGDYSVLRSKFQKPVFKLGDHDRVNTEVLTDIFALSKCQFLVHGFSAVSESAIYLNLNLHNHSVNLEDPNHMSAEVFGGLVQKVIREQRNAAGHESAEQVRQDDKNATKS